MFYVGIYTQNVFLFLYLLLSSLTRNFSNKHIILHCSKDFELHSFTLENLFHEIFSYVSYILIYVISANIFHYVLFSDCIKNFKSYQVCFSFSLSLIYFQMQCIIRCLIPFDNFPPSSVSLK